jgi:hypothetical protein
MRYLIALFAILCLCAGDADSARRVKGPRVKALRGRNFLGARVAHRAFARRVVNVGHVRSFGVGGYGYGSLALSGYGGLAAPMLADACEPTPTLAASLAAPACAPAALSVRSTVYSSAFAAPAFVPSYGVGIRTFGVRRGLLGGGLFGGGGLLNINIGGRRF